MKYQNLRIILISIVFLGLAFFPLINKNFGCVSDIKKFENRRMATEPIFNDAPIDSFPKYYEKYYNDAFPLRSRMVKIFNFLNFCVFDKLPTSDFVIIGKDGWLFLAGEEFEAYTGKNNFTQRQFSQYKEELEYRKKFLEKRGCKFYFMIVPAKACIYSEKVPFEGLQKTKKSVGEELLAYLQKNSSVNTVDLYKVLRENKKKISNLLCN